MVNQNESLLIERDRENLLRIMDDNIPEDIKISIDIASKFAQNEVKEFIVSISEKGTGYAE